MSLNLPTSRLSLLERNAIAELRSLKDGKKGVSRYLREITLLQNMSGELLDMVISCLTGYDPETILIVVTQILQSEQKNLSERQVSLMGKFLQKALVWGTNDELERKEFACQTLLRHSKCNLKTAKYYLTSSLYAVTAIKARGDWSKEALDLLINNDNVYKNGIHLSAIADQKNITAQQQMIVIDHLIVYMPTESELKSHINVKVLDILPFLKTRAVNYLITEYCMYGNFFILAGEILQKTRLRASTLVELYKACQRQGWGLDGPELLILQSSEFKIYSKKHNVNFVNLSKNNIELNRRILTEFVKDYSANSSS